MSNLLRANLVRLLKMKAFWVGMAALTGYGLYFDWDRQYVLQRYGYEATAEMFYQMTFISMLVFGFASAIICSLFVGVEHSDGVIRNKLAVGHKRSAIYLVNFLSCTILSLLIYVVLVVCCGSFTVLAIGVDMVDLRYLLYSFVFGCCLVTSFAALYTMVSLLNSNKTYSVIINICLFIGLLLIASFLFTAMLELDLPEGVRRVYQVLFDFLPGGQSYQLASGEIKEPLRLIGYSVVWNVGVNMIGITVFQRKDIK